MKKRLDGLGMMVAWLVVLPLHEGLACGQGAVAGGGVPEAGVRCMLGRLPLYFVENRGVYPDEVRYYIDGADKTLFFATDGVTFKLKGEGRDWVVKLDFVGRNPGVVPQGEEQQKAVFSYFRGPEKEWRTGLPTFSKVVYRELWPGIDLVYNGTVNQLKYEFVVAPGADPARIRLRYRGAERVHVTERGALRVETPASAIEDAPPVAYQQIGGRRVPVAMAYRLESADVADGTSFGFRLGGYDPAHPLVLDPAFLVYCGFIPDVRSQKGISGIAVDGLGNAYVTGATTNDEKTFPVKVGPDLTHNSPGVAFDVWVAKVNASGTALEYCGYIGGASSDYTYSGIAVDAGGHAYVCGYTMSDERTFPVKVGPDLTFNGLEDIFVARVNAAGTDLDYCGYVGGNKDDRAMDIAVDAAGNAYITGWSDNLSPNRIFAAKVNAQGTALVYMYPIGPGTTGWSIAVDGKGCAYVTGTAGSSFPVLVGPDLTPNGGSDAFVAKVNAAGTGLVYSGFIGGARSDYGRGIAVDAVGNAYVTGITYSDEKSFPVIVGPDLTYKGGPSYNLEEAFVAKVNAAGTGLVYCGYVGGSGSTLGYGDWGYGISVDAGCNAYVAGRAESDENTFPVKVGPDVTHNGGRDAFVAKVNVAGTGFIYCGYLGGSGGEECLDIAIDASGNAYVAGNTGSSNFPVKVGPYVSGDGGFLAKVALTLLGQNGRAGIGCTVPLDVAASDSAGLSYVMGSSLGNGPIAIDQRSIGLSLDDLLVVSVRGYLPGVFRGYAGVIGATGTAAASIQIPNVSALVGVRIYTAFVTLKPSAPSGVQSISNTIDFTIEK